MTDVLFLDIEVAPQICATFSRFNTNIPDYHILQDSFVVSAAWSWNNEERLHHVSVLDDVHRFIKDHTDDYHVIKTLRDEIEKADYIVGHYIKGFDWKIIHGQVMFHRMKPLRKPSMIDTLAEARKARFSSNKLDFLAKKFGFIGKMEHDKDMMMKCSQGDVKAIRQCVRYNRRDIDPMRDLYNAFRAYTHTNQYPKQTDGKTCPFCEARRLQRRGSRGSKIRYECTSCKKWSTRELLGSE